MSLYLGSKSVLSFMSLNDDLLRKQVQIQMDSALQDIEQDYKAIPGPNVKSRWDFIYGYEYGTIVMGVLDYYHYGVNEGSTPKDELMHLADEIKGIQKALVFALYLCTFHISQHRKVS